tara:strand:+ start:1996 stop:2217 length:222 start_codon:yes stop_codon:yes gene_type:complete
MTLEMLNMTWLDDKDYVVSSLMQPVCNTLQSILFFDVKIQQYQSKNSLSQRVIVDCVCSMNRELEQLAGLDVE